MKDYFDKLILQIKYTIETDTCKSDNCIQNNIEYINNTLNNSILYDYLNSKININTTKFNLTDSLDEQLYKNVINYLHKDNIYLYYDVEITHNTNEFTKKVLFFSKILEILFLYFFNNQDNSILIYSRYKHYLYNLLELYKCKVYADLGLEEVPSYRIWNYEKQEFTTIESKQVKIHLNYLTKELLKYESKMDEIAKSTISLLENYYNLWWNEYRKYIEHNFPILKDKLNYYHGIDINITIGKYHSLKDKNFSDSNLALCIGLTNNNNNRANIIINNNIYDITFLNDLYDNDTDVTVTLAFDEDILKNDLEKMIESNIKITINEEIINYYKGIISYEEYMNFCKKLFKNLDYKLDINNKLLNKYNFITDKNEIYKLEFSQSASKEVVEDLGKRRNAETDLLILNKDVLSHSVKKKYEKENIYIKDIDDIFEIAKNDIIFTKNEYLLKNIIYPYIEKEIGIVEKLDNSTISDKLINDIKKCPLGKSGAKQFEDIVFKILNYIFKDSFSKLLIEPQARNFHGIYIKDFIIKNNGIHKFWEDIKTFYNGSIIVIECKNYNNEIGVKELSQVDNYLELSRFGIIFTRKGLDKNAKTIQYEYLKNKNKMILVLDEKDIIDLIRAKSMNENPEDILELIQFKLDRQV